MKSKFNLKIVMSAILVSIFITAYANTDPYAKFDKAKKLKQLTTVELSVTQKADTEPPFNNAYWNNEANGIYVDIVSGEPLFSSTDKFDSGTGWPSFSKPIDKKYIVTKTDSTMFMDRVEVRSRDANSHLGHVFDDGPKPTGLRYCMNSASMRFIPESQMVKSGYGQYMDLFKH